MVRSFVNSVNALEPARQNGASEVGMNKIQIAEAFFVSMAGFIKIQTQPDNNRLCLRFESSQGMEEAQWDAITGKPTGTWTRVDLRDFVYRLPGMWTEDQFLAVLAGLGGRI